MARAREGVRSEEREERSDEQKVVSYSATLRSSRHHFN